MSFHLIYFSPHHFSISQTSDKSLECSDNFNFDQVDDAQRYDDDNFNNSAVASAKFDTLDAASKDLLNRLMEKNPQHRLKSVMALQRISFFHNFNIDDVRHKKVRIIAFVP